MRILEAMLSRLPVLYRNSRQVHALLECFALEFNHMDHAVSRLMRSRWYQVAQGWPPGGKEKQDTELFRIGMLYDLFPYKNEGANHFRKRLFEFIKIHRHGLGTAEAILRLAAQVYQLPGEPQLQWLPGLTRANIETGKPDPQNVILEIVDNPITPKQIAFDSVSPKTILKVNNQGLDPVRPEITINAKHADIPFPAITLNDTGEQILYLGIIPRGGALMLRHDKRALLGGKPAPSPCLYTDALIFDEDNARFYSAETPFARFTYFEVANSIPELSTGESSWSYSTLNYEELKSYLDSYDSLLPCIQQSQAYGESPGPQASVTFTWKESAPAAFHLRIPCNYLPEQFSSFAELAQDLNRALSYGKAAGIQSGIEGVYPKQQEIVGQADHMQTHISINEKPMQTMDDNYKESNARINLEEKNSLRDSFGTEGMFDNGYLDMMTFSHRTKKRDE